MAANEVHENDVGTVFELTIKDGDTALNISSATTKQIMFRKPSGEVVTQTADFSTNGTDGKIKYTTVTDDLNEIGTWKIQGKVILPTGTWNTDINTFKVYCNLV